LSRKPTYRIEGPVERFDERDTVFSREALEPGSPEEIEYHSAHPEKKEIDDNLALFIRRKLEGKSRKDQLGRAVYDAFFTPPAALALPDMVDGDVVEEPVDWDPEEASKRIKEFARLLGADDVRIGPLREEWVYTHKGARPFFRDPYVNHPYFKGIPEGYQGAGYGEKIELKHAHAISMAFKQDAELVGTGSSIAVDFEVGRAYAQSVLASVQLARFIRALGYPARAHHLRNYLIMLVPVAVDAGIGELGRCGYVLSRKLGTNFRLSCVTTDMPLAHDEPVDLGVQDFCEKCRKCADNCPSGTIPRGEKTLVRGVWKWKLNEEACLSFWGKTGYTCSICQVVCPWTKPQTLFHRTVATIAVHVPWIRRALVFGDDVVYGKRFKPKRLPPWLENLS